MEIWHLACNFAPMSVADDRPTVARLSDGGVELEILGRKGSSSYQVRLTHDDCQRIAEAIDWRPVQYAGHPPP